MQAIYGLGGIGKTQTAIEYAHRHRDDYRAVLWVNAGTRDALVSDFVAIARLLDLPERGEQDRNLIVESVRRWMETNDDWLLIIDSADELRLIQPFLPRNLEGRILLISRTQVFQPLGISRPCLLGVMTPEEALEFLFRRTGRSDDDPAERKAAGELAWELDCLPLALEQAGAYITARQTRFRDYLASYHKRRLRLLESSSSAAGEHFPESVVTTWTTSFREVKEASEAAADLLRLSAFLGPDHIPLELIVTGAADLGPALSTSLADASDDPLVVDEVLEPLTRHTLIRHDVEARTYSIQRLVQAVLQDSLDEKFQRLWAERAVRALYRTFPKTPKVANWPLCDRLFPHARACFPFIERWLALPEAGDLLNRAGSYLWARGQFVEAEPMFRQAMRIMEGALGPSDPGTAHTPNNLAVVYEALGRYAEAEELYQQVMAIYEKALGPEHPNLAVVYANHATVLEKLGRNADAEAMTARGRAIQTPFERPAKRGLQTGQARVQTGPADAW